MKKRQIGLISGKSIKVNCLEATGDTGGETTGPLSTNGVIYVSED
jgi:hypothetical protein